MSVTIDIRTAQTADLARLHEIDVAADRRFDELGMADAVAADGIDTDVMRDLIAARRVWVACAPAETIVAFAITAEIDTALHLDRISVHPDHARQGIGRRLMEYLIDQTKQSGRRAITLTAFRDVPWNAPYYARLGFRELRDDELTDGLRQLRDREAATSVGAWPRVCMRMTL